MPTAMSSNIILVAGNWDTQSGDPGAAPGTGKYRADNWTAPTLLAISAQDANGYQRTLSSIAVGDDIVQMASNDSQNYIIMTVTSVTDNVTWAQIGVQVTSTGTTFVAPGSNQRRLLELLRATPSDLPPDVPPETGGPTGLPPLSKR